MSALNPISSEVKLGDWISEGWRMFVEQWKSWVLISLVSVIVIFVAIIPMYVVMFATAGLASGGQAGADLGAAVFMLVAVGWAILVSALSLVLMCGMYKCAFKQLQGGRIEFRDLFSAMNRAPSAFLAGIIIGFLALLGFVLCIVPGFLVMGLYYFTIPLIVFEEMSPFDAMRTSKEVTRQNIWMFTLFAFLVQLLSQAGSYACYVGLLATYPLQFTIGAIAYRDCFGVRGARTFAPQSSPYAAPYSPQYPQYPDQYPGQYPGSYPPPQNPPPYPGQNPVQYPGNYPPQNPGAYPPQNPQQYPPASEDGYPTQSPRPEAGDQSGSSQPSPPPTTVGQPTVSICKACYASIPPNVNFCPSCGANPNA